MTTLRDHLRLHQEATDTNDSTMLNLVCQWIDECGPDLIETDTLIDFVQENLERGPGDVPVPAWQHPMFTEQDREAIISSMMDELADESLKHRAHDALEHMSLAETIGYVFPDDLEALVEMLQRIDNGGDEEYITGEFLRLHNDEDDYDTMLDFCVRMKLLNEAEDTLTDLGREFMGLHL